MTNQVVTFGCRLNISESEIIKNELESSGVDDYIVFNSCAVTAEAERKLRQSIRKNYNLYPDKKIVVTGCAAQIDPRKYQAMPEVDYVLGNVEKLDKASYQHLREGNNVIVSDIMRLEESALHMIKDFEGKARAFVEIQNGCDHRCTFCIIPYGRGNNRSHTVAEIVKACNILVDQGYCEIVFTGVDITDYGASLPGKPKLGQLVRRVLSLCPGLLRLRLSSVDVAEIDEELMELIETEPRLMPHMHLSLQSGDDLILKRMKRRHNRKQVYDFCKDVRRRRPDCSFGADIITGFPTETDSMFQNSFDLVKELSFTHLHVFPYSERDGTPAAKIPENKQVEKSKRKDRANTLRILGQRNMTRYNKSMVGKTLECLIESEKTICSKEFLKISYKNEFKQGALINVLVKGYDELSDHFDLELC
ncbi:MAG: tRNA (N(6)-L-threonylcarbamoyladenosine(37)-C(2))-methylthiotransferase MtaB [Rickettsiales bacterium]|jgi:threonylcarbamoyladenosine tRNA methylthiotransferase MtaB|nr:tRNA (N(6)-L-threonylcarbamoyladenosine(37)-C(2))-methylthiotransferase MtaB [Rickettsiales bacterium]